ncbi:MAG: hypothetical protein WCP14_04390 [bacterium]
MYRDFLLFFGLPILALAVGYQAGTKSISKKFGETVAKIAERDVFSLIWVSVKTLREVIRVDKENAEKLLAYVPKAKRLEAKTFIDEEYDYEHDKNVYYENIEKIVGKKMKSIINGIEDGYPHPTQGEAK